MDRNEFRHILESISVPEDTTSDEMREIMNPITCALRQMAPDRLYKYRSCTDNHISAFEMARYGYPHLICSMIRLIL